MENQQVPKYNYDPQTQAYAPVPEKKTNKWGIAGLICAIVSFFLNPLSLLCPTAIIFSVLGMRASDDTPRGTAIAGLVISLLALFWQIFWDTFWTVLTMGIGLFTFLI